LKLVEFGLQKGDRVGIYSPNNYEWTLMQMACARANLVLVNVNPAFQADELAFCLNKVGVKMLVMAD
jgi:acyl-CoA synthetase (AMP-forming)/AMP-acid ligase II